MLLRLKDLEKKFCNPIVPIRSKSSNFYPRKSISYFVFSSSGWKIQDVESDTSNDSLVREQREDKDKFGNSVQLKKRPTVGPTKQIKT